MQTNKTCPVCNTLGHSKFYCKSRARTPIKVNKPLPLPTKPITKTGKQHKKWANYRKKWKEIHREETKICHICGKFLPNGTFTLDHVIPRSRRPDLVFEDSNIKPACWRCNFDKGSKSMDML